MNGVKKSTATIDAVGWLRQLRELVWPVVGGQNACGSIQPYTLTRYSA